MYELLAMAIQEFAGVRYGQLRSGKRSTWKISIVAPNGGMLFLGSGAGGADNKKGRRSSVTKEDISRHFDKPEYVEMRPSEFRCAIWKGEQWPNRMANPKMASALGGIVNQSLGFNTRLHIEDSPCGELMGHVSGINTRTRKPTAKWTVCCNDPITSPIVLMGGEAMYREHLVMVLKEAVNGPGGEYDRIRTAEQELDVIDRDLEAKRDEARAQMELHLLNRTEWPKIPNQVPLVCYDWASMTTEAKWIQIEMVANSRIRAGASGIDVINQGTESGALNSPANKRVEPEVVAIARPPPPPETRSGGAARGISSRLNREESDVEQGVATATSPNESQKEKGKRNEPTQFTRITEAHQKDWYPKGEGGYKGQYSRQSMIITSGEVQVGIGRTTERATEIQIQMMGKETLREIEENRTITGKQKDIGKSGWKM